MSAAADRHLMDVISHPVISGEVEGLCLMKLWTVEIEAETSVVTQGTSDTRVCSAETDTSHMTCFILTPVLISV